MLFNSIDFAFFLPVVFLIYWFFTQRDLRLRNLFIVLASYVFYGWWDWRFLSLIFFSTVVDYALALLIFRAQLPWVRKGLLWLSLLANLGLLGFFKYYNFFVASFAEAFSFFGTSVQVDTLHIILPVGISFYTFQTLSATIDVYRNKLEPTKDFLAYAAFVSFFPQLVAGPIERATHLLPQFHLQQKFNYAQATDGMKQVLWGFFKKMVIADNCAPFVDQIFSDPTAYSGSTLALGAILFAFQIYGDFSGYSDIAIGISRLFGFNLKQNFAYPYFSRDMAEFWRRWHISLSTWFRDYLYIPLGGSRGSTAKVVRNIFIIFIVSGCWHGANWTFICWGLLNAIYFLPLLLLNKNRHHLNIVAQGRYLPSLNELSGMLFTFMLTVLAWIFFRAATVSLAFTYIIRLFSASLFKEPELDFGIVIPLILVFIMVEWWGREYPYALARIETSWPVITKWSTYVLIVFSIFYLGSFEDHTFIYFQF